jgi:hypothetical protein
VRLDMQFLPLFESSGGGVGKYYSALYCFGHAGMAANRPAARVVGIIARP